MVLFCLEKVPTSGITVYLISNIVYSAPVSWTKVCPIKCTGAEVVFRKGGGGR